MNSISEISYGRGWGMLKDEFESTFRRLTQLGYAIVFIAHSKTRQTEYVDENGDAIEAYAPDLPNTAYQIVNRMVDIIGYIGVEYDTKTGSSSRYLYTRGTPRIFAGSRYKYLAPKIPLGYQELVDAIADAMEKEASLTGTRLITEDELPVPITYRSFEEVMEDAKTNWTRVINTKGQEGREEMRAIIVKVFGADIQLSKTTPDQIDLLEEVVNQIKNIK